MGAELIRELNNGLIDLEEAVREMKKYGAEYAEAESKYKVALMQKALELRDSGMAVTLIDKVVYGFVADERRNRDIAEANYKTSQEKIHAIKLRLKLCDAQISREWGQSR